jgi:Zn-dependent protease with chaperone function
MRFLALETVLSLVWFLALDVMLTAVVVGMAHLCRDAWSDRPAARARFLLTLRLLPGVLATSFVLFAFLPIFWQLEPHDTIEPVSPLLVAGSLAAVFLVVVAMRRGWCAVRHARQVSQRFLQRSTPLRVDVDVPTALVADPASTISLVGVVRPRLFVARRVIEALTPAELRAAIAHEHGHHRSRDNLKRLAMAWWPDALALTATGVWLEREWARAAEIAADAVAAGTNAARALDLASALVKVARLASIPSSASVLHSTLHDGGDIATRVRRLAALADARPALPVTRFTGLARAIVGATAAVVFAIFCVPQVPSVVQHLTELIVRFAS